MPFPRSAIAPGSKWHLVIHVGSNGCIDCRHAGLWRLADTDKGGNGDAADTLLPVLEARQRQLDDGIIVRLAPQHLPAFVNHAANSAAAGDAGRAEDEEFAVFGL
jgi:hypothetical protein